ncbi:MAG TPA: hypothetical protein PLC06_13080 [Promineifilum sp.]|nr:hypothetical protein [Promineifilum sp.]
MSDVTRKPALDNISIEFLLKEYERLSEYQKASFDMYHRRFDIYLAAVSGTLLIAVALSQTTQSPFQQTAITTLLVVLLVIGLNVFASLSYSNASQVHLERATRLIQSCFIERDAGINGFLYFDKHRSSISGTDLRTLLIRGITGGGPKSILVIVNSLLVSILLIRFVKLVGEIDLPFPVQVLVGVGAFLLCSILHVVYARWIYRINGI